MTDDDLNDRVVARLRNLADSIETGESRANSLSEKPNLDPVTKEIMGKVVEVRTEWCEDD